MTDDVVSTQQQRWLDAWEEKRRKTADGAMSGAEVCEWVWKNKVLNAINVTIQRIKRSERPGRDPRRTDNTWITIAAERGRSQADVSPLATSTLDYVVQRLRERGHEFDVDWMMSASGLVIVSVNVKSLRAYMQRKAGAESPGA